MFIGSRNKQFSVCWIQESKIRKRKGKAKPKDWFVKRLYIETACTFDQLLFRVNRVYRGGWSGVWRCCLFLNQAWNSPKMSYCTERTYINRYYLQWIFLKKIIMIQKCLIQREIVKNRWEMAVFGGSGGSAAVYLQIHIPLHKWHIHHHLPPL